MDNRAKPSISKERVDDLLDKAPYREAVTMKHIPHSYTLKKEWSPDDFVATVKFIRENGVEGYFGNMKFIYYYANGYKYWTCGDTIPNTILINREVFGEARK